MTLLQQYAYWTVIILFAVYFGTKIFDWFDKRRKSFYKDDKSWFMAKMYQLQSKCTRKGLVEYADAINLIIRGFNLPKEEEEPSTTYGKDLKEKMTNNIQ